MSNIEYKKEEIAKKYNISPIVLELMAGRGVTSEEKLKQYLNPTDSSFYNPFLLSGMKELVERIKLAIKNNEKVLIFGDYDVDGVSASAILIKYFAERNFYVDYFLPNRYVDGYGLTKDSILRVKDKFNPSLIITVDCGISCHEEVEFAKALGIDIVITDHHDIPEILPNTIVVDPKLPNQQYPFKSLCGTGVAFKVVQALSGLEEAKKYLGITAIATIADIVPLEDENRAIVKLGMATFEKTLPLGIKMLFEENKMQLNCSSTDIAYKLSPKINAAGRMGDAGVALKLYIKDDKLLLKNTIASLGNLNTERQALCNRIYDDVVDKLSQINIANYKSIVLFSKKWDSGVLGIVAAKIAGEYNRPTILLSDMGEELRGSARSINDIDIFSAISSTKETLETFGGHKMAAGLTIRKKQFSDFLSSLNNYLDKHYSPDDFLPCEKFDMEIKPEQICDKLISDLELIEPCGCGNPKPVFKMELCDGATFSTMPKHPSHLTIFNKNLNIIAFNSYKYLPLLKSSTDRSVQMEFQNSSYKGKKYYKGIAKDISTGKLTKPKSDDVLLGEYLKQMSYGSCGTKKTQFWDKNKLKQIIKQAKQDAFGTLFVSYSYGAYREFCIENADLKINHCLYEIIKNSGMNSIVLCPTSFDNFGSYKRIVFLDGVLSSGFLTEIAKHSGATLFVPADKKIDRKIFAGLSTDRKVFGRYFKLLSDFASKQESFLSDISLFKQLQSKDRSINFKQFIFSLYVFLELKIFEIQDDLGLKSLKENKKVVSPLTNSSFYNEVCLTLKSV